MANRSSRTRQLRRPGTLTLLLLGTSILILTACSRASEGQSTPTEPASISSADPAVTSSSPQPPTTQTSPPHSVPLLAPSAVVSAGPSAPSNLDVQSPPVEQSASPNSEMQVRTPPPPRAPQPAPLDSRGFPLGTTCGPISCTSPDGMTFINPDALPGMSGQTSELICGQTFCSPPDLQIVPDPLPSTGSAE